MKVLALFLWLAVPIGGYAIYQAWGTPHMIWSYTYRAYGGEPGFFGSRFYTSCTYLGWGFHQVTTPAQGGRCKIMRFFKKAQG